MDSDQRQSGHMPSDVTESMGVFDRFANATSIAASRAPFFAFCVLLIVVWAPSIVFLPLDTWQLIINTATTIITFLMVALLQNSQSRNDRAVHDKLNAIADALADFMESQATKAEDQRLRDDLRELRTAVGIEDRETSS